MRIRTQCRECGLPFKTTIAAGEPLPCPNCGTARAVAGDGWSAEERRVDVCPLCDCKHLYRQRDVNRSLGCVLVAIGVVLAFWTYGLSLVVMSAIDFLVFRKLEDAVVCYRCDTVFRDATPSSRQGEFNLLKHDVLKYGKALPLDAPEETPAEEPEGSALRRWLGLPSR